jgi:RimJ/RimL family protein N-acetyltransferase
MPIIFRTKRLNVRLPNDEQDIDVLFALWNDPEIMKFVGFPEGLGQSREKIKVQIAGEVGKIFDSVLMIEKRDDGAVVGHCRLGNPSTDGVSAPDLKLLPQYHGKGFGVEILKAIVSYTFANTGTQIVQGTPNQHNLASVKMQEKCGFRKTGKGLTQIPQSANRKTCEVPYFIYQIEKNEWQKLYSK